MKEKIKLLISLIVFLYISIVPLAIAKFEFGIDISNMSKTTYNVILLSTEILSAIVMVILYFKVIKKSVIKMQKIKKESKITDFLGTVIKAYLVCFLVNLIATFVANLIGTFIGIDIIKSVNQSGVEVLAKNSALIMAISACLFAPIAEEIMFRGAIGEVIKNKKVFVVVSGLIFGLLHVIEGGNLTSLELIIEILIIGILLSNILENDKYSNQKKITLSIIVSVVILVLFGFIYHLQFGNLILKIKSLQASEALASISYIAFGSMIAYYYKKYDNIFVNIGIHFIQNSLAMILMLCL